MENVIVFCNEYLIFFSRINLYKIRKHFEAKRAVLARRYQDIIDNSYRNSQQDATVYENLLFHVYMKLNMFRATNRPPSGVQNCTSSLWLCIRERLLDAEVAGRCQRPATSKSKTLSRIKNQRLLVQF